MALKITDACTCNYLQLLGGAPNLTLLRTLAGVLGEKIHIRAILKENTTNYYIVGKLNKCRFLKKKNKLPVSSIPQNKIANNHKNDHVSFNWINRVSNPSALAK